MRGRLYSIISILPPAYEACGKIMFSVCLSAHSGRGGGMLLPGPVWTGPVQERGTPCPVWAGPVGGGGYPGYDKTSPTPSPTRHDVHAEGLFCYTGVCKVQLCNNDWLLQVTGFLVILCHFSLMSNLTSSHIASLFQCHFNVVSTVQNKALQKVTFWGFSLFYW